MDRQLVFDLPARPALGREDFLVTPANELAVAEVENWRNWPARKLLLIGPAGSGKTHLAHVWTAETGARIVPAKELENLAQDEGARVPRHIAIEDVDHIAGHDRAEAALFHLHNLILGGGGRLLMTAETPPSNWPVTLPDLASRLVGTPLSRLDPPDDALLAAIMVKLFADRQLSVEPAVISYLVERMDRSFDAAQRLVAALDAEALRRRRRITRKLAGAVLDMVSGTDT